MAVLNPGAVASVPLLEDMKHATLSGDDRKSFLPTVPDHVPVSLVAYRGTIVVQRRQAAIARVLKVPAILFHPSVIQYRVVDGQPEAILQ